MLQPEASWNSDSPSPHRAKELESAFQQSSRWFVWKLSLRNQEIEKKDKSVWDSTDGSVGLEELGGLLFKSWAEKKSDIGRGRVTREEGGTSAEVK